MSALDEDPAAFNPQAKAFQPSNGPVAQGVMKEDPAAFNPQAKAFQLSEEGKGKMKGSVVLCRFFLSKKGCNNGAGCCYSHSSAAADVAANASTPQAACQFFVQGVCKNGQGCSFSFSHDGGGSKVTWAAIPYLAPTANEESETEMEIAVAGATKVLFGPGGRVISVNTCAAGRSHRVAVNRLTGDVDDASIISALTVFEEVTALLRPAATYAIATFFDSTKAQNCVLCLDGFPLLHLKSVSAKLLPEPGCAITTQASAVKVSWFDPSRTCYAHFTSLCRAQHAAKACNGKIPNKKAAVPIRTVLQHPTPGTRIFSVILQGMGERATEKDVYEFVKRYSRNVTPSNVVLGTPTFRDAPSAVAGLLQSCDGFVQDSLVLMPATTSARRKAVVRYATASDAARAVAILKSSGPQISLGGQPLHAEQVLSAKVTLLNGVYRVLKTRINGLVLAAAPALQSVIHQGENTTVLKIRGSSTQVVANTKGEMERILRCERFVETSGGVRCVPVLARCFESRTADANLEAIGVTLGGNVFVHPDHRRRELRFFGEQSAVEKAKVLVRTLVDAYNSSHHILPLPSAATRRYFSKPAMLPRKSSFDSARGALFVKGMCGV
jgi:hypothetical protein